VVEVLLLLVKQLLLDLEVMAETVIFLACLLLQLMLLVVVVVADLFVLVLELEQVAN
jgi:hypothetical protein